MVQDSDSLLALVLPPGAVPRRRAAVYAQALDVQPGRLQGSAGLTAAVAGDALAVTWDGDANQEVRLQLTINGGTPTIKDLAVRRKGGAWATVASNLTPEYRVVSGWRRIDQEAYRSWSRSSGRSTRR